MNKTTYQHVYTEHFCHQLWKNNLALTQQELTLYRQILSRPATSDGASLPAASVSRELSQQLSHFQRILPTLKMSLEEVEKLLAADVQHHNRIGAETRKDHALF